MKKGLLTLSAGIIAATFAFAAFAQDAKPADAPKPAGPAFTFSIAGSAKLVTFQTIYKDAQDKAMKGDYAESRVRPEMKLSDGTSTFSMRWEIDNTWGYQVPGTWKPSTATPRNMDTYNMEVAWMYFNSKVKQVAGLEVTAGIAPVDYGFWYADNAPLFGVSYATGPVKVTINKVFLAEKEKVADKGAVTTDQNSSDANFYGVDAAIKMGDISVRPMLTYLRSGRLADAATYKGVPAQNATIYMLGVDSTVKAGIISVRFLGQYVGGKEKVADTKFSAYAFDLAPTFDLGVAKVTGFINMVSGDKYDNTDKYNGFTGLSLDGIAGAGASRLMILQEAGIIGSTNTSNETGARVRGKGIGVEGGYLLYGVSAVVKFGDLQSTIALGSGMLAQKTQEEGKKDLGYEFDLMNKFSISDATSLQLDFGFLKTGKAYNRGFDGTGAAEVDVVNAYEVIFGVQQKM